MFQHPGYLFVEDSAVVLVLVCAVLAARLWITVFLEVRFVFPVSVVVDSTAFQLKREISQLSLCYHAMKAPRINHQEVGF